MQYLADQYSCESPYALGVRIQSVGLPISVRQRGSVFALRVYDWCPILIFLFLFGFQTLSKAYSYENACLERAREAIQKEIEEEVASRLWKIKKSLLEPAQGMPCYSSSGSLELRKKYVSLTAADAVLEIFTNSEGIFNERMTKVNKFRLRHMVCFSDL